MFKSLSKNKLKRSGRNGKMGNGNMAEKRFMGGGEKEEEVGFMV